MPLDIVVLDTCVLYPPSLRDTLLCVAEGKLYIAHWSAEILEELKRNLIKNKVDENSIKRLMNNLSVVFYEAPVRDYERHISHLTNHPKDRHVLAAAIEAQASIIVTSNLRDFPNDALAPWNVRAQSPDD